MSKKRQGFVAAGRASPAIASGLPTSWPGTKNGAIARKKLSEMFPGLTLADIHAALTYYFDYPQEIEDDLPNIRGMVRVAQSERSFQDSCHASGEAGVAEPIRFFMDQHFPVQVSLGLRRSWDRCLDSPGSRAMRFIRTLINYILQPAKVACW